MIINTYASITDLAMARSFRLHDFTVVTDRRSLVFLQDMKVALGCFLFELSRVAEVAEKVRDKNRKAKNEVRYCKVSIILDALADNKAHIQDIVAEE